ncbi:MAG: hypothetical protein KDK97_10385 [Verrucomicrobiales bacterium]|nr:hypothetical protein [Verrucomicrobiales bacterium]
MNNWISIASIPLAVTKAPLGTLLTIGAFAATGLIAWSYSHWRTAVKVAFIAVLFEGAIRKWILPQGEELVYFLKDVFLVGAYLKFYFSPDPDIRAYRLRIPGMVIFVLCAIVSLSALNPNINSILLSTYGLKIYFFYVPMAFMMPLLFKSEKEMVNQLTWYALIAIPICLLGFLQWKSDTFSILNTFAAGMDEKGATTFGFGDKARITGTFSYLTGHTTFVIFFSGLCITLLSLKETPLKWLLLGVTLPMLVANALMGGSRASLITIAFIGGGFAIASMGGRIGSSKYFVRMLLIGTLAAAAGGAYMFTDAWQSWSLRYQVSGDNIKQRVFDMQYEAVTKALADGGLAGYGMGTAHPATDAIRQRLRMPAIKDKAPVYDSEVGQVMVELGIVGFLSWYTLRLMLVFLAWSSYRRSPPGAIRALSLAGVLITTPYLLMSVVYNHTANFLVFGLGGFALIPLLEPTIQRRFARGKPTQSPHAATHRSGM